MNICIPEEKWERVLKDLGVKSDKHIAKEIGISHTSVLLKRRGTWDQGLQIYEY